MISELRRLNWVPKQWAKRHHDDRAMKFETGDRVRVHDRKIEGHCRTPHYLRGKEGTIEQSVGEFRNPERLAYHEAGLPKQELYRVRFMQTDLWPAYKDGLRDSLVADLYEHWLDSA